VRSSGRVILVVILLAGLHFLLRIGLGIGSVAPDLLTLSLLIGAREVRMGGGAALGLFYGLLEDSFSVLAFGGSAVAMTLVGAAGARTRDLFVGDSLIFLVSYLVLGKWVRDLIQWLVVSESVRQPFTDAVIVQAPIAAVYMAIVGVIAVAVTGSWWDTAR
jgi:cell shape-determining protein MreD